MLANPLPPSFLDTYSLSTLSLESKVLHMVISFLVFWPICLTSSLVYFKNGPEYFTKGTAPIFILLLRFLRFCLVSSSFLFLLRYSFLIFSFISTYLRCLLPISQVFVDFLFSESSNFFLSLVVEFRFCHVSFSAFHYKHGAFFYTKFHPYVLIVYPVCVY